MSRSASEFGILDFILYNFARHVSDLIVFFRRIVKSDIPKSLADLSII